MSVIKMVEFGRVLTGREYGLNAAKKLLAQQSPPFTFDFAGVLSLGSSFGDEIFKAAKAMSNEPIKVINANKPVSNALFQVKADLGIELEVN